MSHDAPTMLSTTDSSAANTQDAHLHDERRAAQRHSTSSATPPTASVIAERESGDLQQVRPAHRRSSPMSSR